MALVFPEDKRSYQGSLRFTLVGPDNQPVKDRPNQVELYLPQGLQISDKVEYENSDLGLLGGAIEGAGKGEGGVPISEIFSDDEAKKNLIDGLVAKVGAKAGDAFRARNKTAPNPNTRALFKQVSLRTFQFSFKLVPVNEREAKNISEIIKFFRTELYPEDIKETVQGTELAIAYKFPDRIQVEMSHDKQIVGPKIAPAYIDSFTTNYNSGSQTFLKGEDGTAYFSETDINFSLTESTALSREAIKEGF